MGNSRKLLLGLAQSAIDAVHGARLAAMAAAQFPSGQAVYPVAIGKAAPAMMAGLASVLGTSIQRGLVISAKSYAAGRSLDPQRFETLYGGHPLPTEDSLIAGSRLLQWIGDTPGDAYLLFLISGGASAMLEVLEAEVTFSDLQQVNRWLLGSGLDIAQINAVRCCLSRIKGGKLLNALRSRPAEVWLLSDVAGDDPGVIGSGLLYPVRHPVSETSYPDWLQRLLGATADKPGATPGPDLTVPVHRLLGSLADACRSATQTARQLGLPVRLHTTEISGDAKAAGERLAKMLISAPPGIQIWGGETTVRLPAQPGVGGRNQHLALAAAMRLSGHDGVQLLALATDGYDGPGEDAGALVDGGTIARGSLAGLDAAELLERADSGRFLQASGDLVATGPTGTNVRDLVLGWKAG